MKKFILMMTAVIAMAFSSKAEIVTVDGLNYDIDKDSETATLTLGNTAIKNSESSFTGNSYTVESVSIPATINYQGETYDVTAIGGGAFYGSTKLKSIILPESILSIGNCAFQGCTALTSIDIPEEVQTIGIYVFYGCSALERVTMGDEVTDLGEYAFYQCGKLNSIKLSRKIKELGDRTFQACYELTEIVFPQFAKKMGYGVFMGCSKLKKIDFSQNQALEIIGDYAFDGTTVLDEIILPESVVSIGQLAFRSSGIEKIYIPSNSTLNLNSSFDHCTNLKKVKLPKTLLVSASVISNTFNWCKNIEEIEFDKECEFLNYGSMLTQDNVKAVRTFEGCDNLKRILNFPSSITSAQSAYNGCYSLEYITAENHFTSIQDNMFNSCNSLKSLYLPFLNDISSTTSVTYTWFSGTSLEYLFLGPDFKTASSNIKSVVPSTLKTVCLATTPPQVGSGTWLADDVRRDGVLYVPQESLDKYKNANWWMGFRDIRPYVYMKNLKLTAKTIKLQVGTTMTLTPTYDNDASYPFFHWDSSDENVATIDWEGLITGVSTGESTINARALDLSGETADIKIKVVDYCPTDPNNDGKTTVADATAIAKEILKNIFNPVKDERYDVNGDGKIDINDILAVIDTILDDYIPGRSNVRGATEATANDMLVAENFVMEANGHAVVPVRLEGLSQYSALQADVTVEGGISIDDITLGSRIASTHAIATKKLADNTMRVVVYAAGADLFADNDEPILNINISGEARNGSVNISNILATEDGERDAVLGFSGGMQNAVTGIDGVNNGAAAVYSNDGAIVVANALGCEVKVYNVSGEVIESVVAASNPAIFNVAAGVYVVTVDGESRKVIVK